MKCKKVLKQLVAYRDKELSKKEAQPVEEHLSGCRNCTETLNRHHRLAHVLSSVDFSDEPSPEVFDTIRGRIRDTLEKDNAPASFRDNFLPSSILARFQSGYLGPRLSWAMLLLITVLMGNAIWTHSSYYQRQIMDTGIRRLTKREMMNIKGGNIPPSAILQTSPWQTISARSQDNYQIALNKATLVKVWEGEEEYRLTLSRGEVWISPQEEAKEIRVATPLGQVEAKGAEFYVEVDEEKVTVTVTYGKVLLRTNSSEQEISAGTKSYASSGGDISEPEGITIKEASRWARW